MTEKLVVKEIIFYPRPLTRTLVWVHFGAFWLVLLGGLYLSQLIFGGHWLVDILAALLALFMLILGAPRLVAGNRVRTTPQELAAWLGDGAPENFVSWRQWRKNPLPPDLGSQHFAAPDREVPRDPGRTTH